MVMRCLHRRLLSLGLITSLTLVAALTLSPQGTGWAWGSPTAELRWYVTGLGSPDTVVQLVGNLALLALPAAVSVQRWPALGRLPRLASAGLATGTAIELLQRLLPLGRVVSPMDALLNATGAVLAGMVTSQAVRRGALGRVRATTA